MKGEHQADNPHNLLDRMNEKGVPGIWKCHYCGKQGSIEDMGMDCTYEYPPCKTCGQTPECAPDCAAVRMLLTQPHAPSVGGRN